MAITPSKLRANVYRILDEVLDGHSVEVVRKGKIIKIMSADKPIDKLAKLKKHPGTIIGDPDDLVHMDWSQYWDPDQNINQ